MGVWMKKKIFISHASEDKKAFVRPLAEALYSDLDHLAGTWSTQDSDDFLSATAVFEKVDEDMWK